MQQEASPEQSAVVNEKLSIGKEKKEKGDEHFKAGETKQALSYYHQSVLYIQGLDKSVLGAVSGATAESGKDKKTEADVLLEKIYANMCACHIKHENWKRAEETANQVLKKNPDNTKASFRKAKALAGQGYFEKAIKILEDLISKNPEDATFKVELNTVRIKDKEASAKGLAKFKGFLSKDKSSILSAESVEEVSGRLEDSKIEEVK